MPTAPSLAHTLAVLQAALARKSEPRLVPGSIEAMAQHLREQRLTNTRVDG